MISKIFKKQEIKKGDGRIKNFFSKLSQAFMLPISVLPIAGLLLGIGGAIGANTTGPGAQEFAAFLKGASTVIFDNLAILFGASVAMAFTRKNSLYAVFMLLIAYFIFSGTQTGFIHFGKNGDFKNIFWMHTNDDLKFMVATNLGITSLRTSIFGGIVIGSLVAYVMNRWSEVQLPLALNFFSGIRLVPMLLMPIAIFMALLFLVFWPFVGNAIAWLGDISNKAPGGVDGLVYGITGRALMPFGLHHIVIGLAFQSSLGGELTVNDILDAAKSLGVEGTKEIQELITRLNETPNNGIIVGDQAIWNFLNGLLMNRLPINGTGSSTPLFEWVAKYAGVYAGRYTQDYATYLGACMGLGAAMILAADKDKRKRTATIIGSSMVVAFLTGITEPLEFSFLFAAPLFYYIIYVPLSGVSYMMMKLFGAHVGVGFARGFIDMMVYGAIPVSKGTMFWVVFPLAAVEGLIAFVLFFFGIKRFDWKTPGRGGEVVLIDKKTYKNLRKNFDETKEYIKAYGGVENIISVTACATRLRITVKDSKKIIKEILIELGSKGFIENGNSSQNVLGGRANIISGRIKEEYNIN